MQCIEQEKKLEYRTKVVSLFWPILYIVDLVTLNCGRIYQWRYFLLPFV